MLKVTFILFLVLAMHFAQANPVCRQIFVAEEVHVQQAISSLAKLRVQLDTAQAEGASSLARTAMSTQYQKKEAKLIQYFEEHQIMTREDFFAALRKQIQMHQGLEVEEISKDKKDREEQRVALAELKLGARMEFNRVEPGPFLQGIGGAPSIYGRNKNQKTIEIKNPFQMASTVTTQLVWREVVLAAKNRFPEKYAAMNEDPSFFKGDLLPVEKVTHADVMQWIEALNALALAHDSVVKKLMPGHQDGEVYRLPTSHEYEFVETKRGHIKQLSSETDQEKYKYAWVFGNSSMKTHAVGELDPFILDGQSFYDLYGNVSVWTSTKSVTSSRPAFILAGASSMSTWVGLGGRAVGNSTGQGSSDNGFRLVRSVPVQPKTFAEKAKAKIGMFNEENP